jgi:hypothetical protein
MCKPLTDLHGAANTLLSSPLANRHHIAVGTVMGAEPLNGSSPRIVWGNSTEQRTNGTKSELLASQKRPKPAF